MKAIDMIHNKLSARQVLVLEMLKEGDKTSADLASEHLSTASLTAIIDKFEARGLAQRVRCRHDRRKITISLTNAGRELIN
jgi:DNA-binding MarR family transcriptional regulator